LAADGTSMTKRTDPHWEHAGLAPPRRLGTLLAQAREASGTTLDELAASSTEWSVARLEAVERGGVEFDDSQLAGVASLYGVDVATIVPPRSKLVVDLDEGILRVDGRRSATEVGDGADRHEVLARYLALVYSMRQVQPGTELTLRVDDLDVLGTCLRVGRPTLLADLESLMDNPDDLVGWRLRLLRKKVLVPAAGILISFCGAAALILASGEAATASPVPANARSVHTHIESTTTTSGVSIGDATVQGRNADGSPGPVVVRDGP
jgi:transcriptional regulator with XRE-family HTH domain